MRELYLANNQLATLPEAIGQLTTLLSVFLFGNQLTALPEAIGQLTGLQTLFLSGNQLTALPEAIGQLTGLQTLFLSGNQLTALPEAIGQLRSVRTLDLSGNQLTALPEAIGQLTGLQTLFLSGNQLTALPEAIGQLRSVRTLDLSGNQLTALPESLRRLKQLNHLSLHGNPALELPPEILGNRITAAKPDQILDYYFRTQKAHRPLNEAKLILVGRGGVGKTCLVNRLVHDTFDQHQDQTDGIQITDWPIRSDGGDEVRLHIWDFGGQEIMHATHQFFLTERSLYLLVLSGREGAEDRDAEYWLRMIESFGAESPVIVVLNKIQTIPFDVNRRALQTKYLGIREFLRTDCKDRAGIDDLRAAIQREIDRLENVRAKFPAQWFSIKDGLSATGKNYLTYDEYRAFCQQHGETNPNAQDHLAEHMHRLGVALNFKDDPRLQVAYILNPHWVTTGVYKILNAPLLAERKGELGLTDLPRLLDSVAYPWPMHRFLLDLMMKFELCFTYPGDETKFLVPELLDKQEAAEAADFAREQCLNFEYHYSVVPEGLLPRFIVRTHARSEGLPRWRMGVILQFEGNRAFAKADPAEKKVVISVAGPASGRRRLLAIIRSNFDDIHRDIPMLRPQEMVPVPGHPTVVVSYKKLSVLEEKGIVELQEVIGDDVLNLNVRDLLNGVDSKLADQKAPIAFISYSHDSDEHADRVLALADALLADGIDVILDRYVHPAEGRLAPLDGQEDR